ncbi:MAG TPA: PhnD/SsuA/transferrin family substrate-binding protein [Phycisphaerae bacterium]|nr:PhnD/SsuA/transferrin family substrate-binding protein [Phycisphaerae bacterium]
MPRRFFVGWTLLLAVLVAGCGRSELFSESVWDPFGLTRAFGPHAEPVRIGLSYEQAGVFDVRRWGKQAPWDTLVRKLSAELGRPVEIENLEPFQIEFHLRETGRLQFALVTAADYLEMSASGPVGEVLAISETRTRQGVIVAGAKSDIGGIKELRGRRFAFGPRGDAVLHDATLLTLADAGVARSDLATLIPGVLQFHISSREAAKEVAYGLTGAGVIEAEEFDAYPATGGRWVPFAETFSKDQFRELGRTPAIREQTMGEGPFVAGPHTDRELAERVRAFLLAAKRDNPQVVRSLGFGRFRPAPADPTDEIKHLAEASSP